MKDKDYFAKLCDFSKLSNFVQNYSSNYYERNPYTTPASCPATEDSMQIIGEKMYDEFNNHIDTLLEM